MSSLPLQRFRRIIHQLQTTPELCDRAFRDMDLAPDAIMAPNFALNDAILWRFAENLQDIYGTYWCAQFPLLWSLDVHGLLESAARVAPTLRHAMDVIVRFSHRRWQFAQWQIVVDGQDAMLVFGQVRPIGDAHWHNFSVIGLMNFQTVLASSFPDVLPHVHFMLEGPPPDGAAVPFARPVAWSAARCAAVFPAAMLASPSTMADAHIFASMLAALDITPTAQPVTVTARVIQHLGPNPTAQASIDRIASAMGVSGRTLERQLATENASFRALHSDALKQRLNSLLEDDSLSLACVAEKLGYSDETALSRAARRWYGKTLSQLRRERVRPMLHAG
jgi:AraC-like DNA-binding protein